ncbi:MAG: shikimate kinase [Armatimonadota bacterium]
MEDNIILIGPPGVGKSTVGVLLAKAMSMPFIDTDICIQASEGMRLQEILDSIGIKAFIKLEEEHILQIDVNHHVIATGGSVIYSNRSMQWLKNSGSTIFLNLDCDTLVRRIHNLDTRGVVKPEDQSFKELYNERIPIYRRYADAEVDCGGFTHDEAVAAIIKILQGME